jgi:PBP1b-binding outer membrane lipoprotein LpoB
MKKIFILFFALFTGLNGNAQTAEDSVKTTINHFFEGMKKADTTLLKSTMMESIIFQTIARNKEGETVVKTENVAAFLTSIATLQKDVADERISFETIKIDANLASVWTPYKFYMGEKFSHCGANSFQLIRQNGVWKIQYIIDTRRKQGCD